MSELESLAQARFLMTGAGGMLGSAFAETIFKQLPGAGVRALEHAQLDVTDRDAMLLQADFKPHFIIHCAARADADACERDPEMCRRVKVGGMQNVILLAQHCGAKVLYPQSFLIFGESDQPLTESAQAKPLSVYGQCKLEAEQLLRAALPDSLMVRMGALFGACARDKNFIGKFFTILLRLRAENKRRCQVGDRIWQPSYTLDLAYNSLLLLALQKQGVYHMASHGQASFFEVARFMVDQLGLATAIDLVPVSAKQVQTQEAARRPFKALLENARLKQEGLDRQRSWRKALQDYLALPYFRVHP